MARVTGHSRWPADDNKDATSSIEAATSTVCKQPETADDDGGSMSGASQAADVFEQPYTADDNWR